MSIAGYTFTTITETLGRTLRNFGAASRPDDTFDPYDPIPLKKEELTVLFELPTGAPLSKVEELRESELLERESMSLIRNALYASD